MGLSLAHDVIGTSSRRYFRRVRQSMRGLVRGKRLLWADGRQPLPNRVTSELLVIRPESMPSAEITSCKPTRYRSREDVLESLSSSEAQRDRSSRSQSLDVAHARLPSLASVLVSDRPNPTSSDSTFACGNGSAWNWRAPSHCTRVRSAIVDGLESRQRTIGSAWSSDGSALESRLGSCPI
jgi:hypothetical protein